MRLMRHSMLVLNPKTRLAYHRSIYGQLHTSVKNSVVFSTLIRRTSLRPQDTQIHALLFLRGRGNQFYEKMKKSRVILMLLTLAFIVSVATIVGLMVTAVQMVPETGTTPTLTTTTTATFSTTSTSPMTSSTTTTTLSTTTTNLDEWLCDNWICDWKG